MAGGTGYCILDSPILIIKRSPSTLCLMIEQYVVYPDYYHRGPGIYFTRGQAKFIHFSPAIALLYPASPYSLGNPASRLDYFVFIRPASECQTESCKKAKITFMPMLQIYRPVTSLANKTGKKILPIKRIGGAKGYRYDKEKPSYQ